MQDHPPVHDIVVIHRIKAHALVRHNAVARAGQGRPGVVLPDIQMCIFILVQEHCLVRMHVLVHAHFRAFRVVIQVDVHHVVVPVGGGGGLALGEQVLHDAHYPLGSLQPDMRVNGQLRGSLVRRDAGPVSGHAGIAQLFEIDVLGFAALDGVAADIHPPILVHGVSALVRRIVVQLHPQLHSGLCDGFIRDKAEGGTL